MISHNIKNNSNQEPLTQKVDPKAIQKARNMTGSGLTGKALALVLGLSGATVGYTGTEYMRINENNRDHLHAALETLDENMLLDAQLQTNIIDNTLKDKTKVDFLQVAEANRKKQSNRFDLIKTMHDDNGFNYKALAIGLGAGLLGLLTAGKKLNPGLVAEKIQDIASGLIETAQHDEIYDILSGKKYSIDFQTFFENTIEGLLKSKFIKNNNVKLAIHEHKGHFLEAFRLLVIRNRIFEAEKIIKNFRALGLRKAELLDIVNNEAHIYGTKEHNQLCRSKLRENLERFQENGLPKTKSSEQLELTYSSLARPKELY